jgi:hypothetical protein
MNNCEVYSENKCLRTAIAKIKKHFGVDVGGGEK